MKLKIVGKPLPNIPWQPRAAGDSDLLWRYDQNPVIGRRPLPARHRHLQQRRRAVAGRFHRCLPHGRHVARPAPARRAQRRRREVHFEPKPIVLKNADPEVTKFEYAYDPRVTEIDGIHYVTWCNGYHGPTIGIAKTTDFVNFEQCENAFLPFNRNGVLFPRKINGKFVMLSRPSDTGHTPFGDIFTSESGSPILGASTAT